MKFYRIYFDETKKEEITEEIVKDRLSEYYKDTNRAIDAMKGGATLNTVSAYYWYE